MSAQFQIMHRIVVTVTTAGTPVQVSATPLYVRSFIGQGHHGNAGKIFIGDSALNAATALAHALDAMDTYGASGDMLGQRDLQFDLSQVWVDASVNGQKFIVTYMQEVLNR